MEVKLRFSLADASGKVKAMDDATAVLGQEDLVIRPASSGPQHYSLRDMASIGEGEYRILIGLRSSDTLMLFNIGQKYDDLARELHRSANDLELKDLLFDEKLLKQGVKGECALTKGGERADMGKCEARLYQTAMVVLPDHARLYRARFADVLSTDVHDFKLSIRMENGDALEISKLGGELDPLRKGIVDTSADLSTQVQRMIRDAHPGAEPEGVARAARLMREGTPAGRGALEAVCPGLWQGLEKKVAGSGIGEEYAYLADLAKAGGIRIGVKRPLQGPGEDEGTQDYLFLLAPIFSTDRSKGGNAVAFEASSGEEEGRATYFFRIWGRNDYPMGSKEAMEKEAGEFVSSLATGLNAINFRREPIYLEEEKLFEPDYARYRWAIIRIPELKLLRERFVGRVIHSSPEQWKEDVKALLAFNVAQKDDRTKWKKTEQATPEESK